MRKSRSGFSRWRKIETWIRAGKITGLEDPSPGFCITLDFVDAGKKQKSAPRKQKKA